MIEDMSIWEEVRPSSQVCIRTVPLIGKQFYYVFRQLTPNVRYCRALVEWESIIKDPMFAPYLFVDVRSAINKRITGIHIIKP